MKHIFVIILLLTAFTSFSQTQTIDSIPKDGIVLNKEWKFHAGDDDAGLHHYLFDKAWQNIDPATDVYYLQNVRKAEIGWLRLKLHFDSSLINQSYSLSVTQTCASEIYLDGKLIYRLGRVSKDYKTERTFNPYERPYSLQLNGQQNQEIEVKFSFNNKNLIINYVRDNPLLRMGLFKTNELYNARLSIYGLYISAREYILIACYVLLTIISAFLVSLYRFQKAYLYFGIYSFGSIVQTLLRFPSFSMTTLTVTQVSICLLLSHIISLFLLIIFLNGMYKIYNNKKGILYSLILIYAVLTVPAFFFLYPLSGLLSLCFSFLIAADLFRIIYKPARQGDWGARILMIVFSAFCILFAAFITFVTLKQATLAGNFAILGLFIIPVGVLSFIGNEFLVASKSLQNKMKEVATLAAEKQQILISQNETLEQQVTQRTADLNQSLQELKSTQSQLIQSEKMASLGELTAGIAHEIQNPLNFVNNFSEVNNELVDEINNETDIDEIKAIANDIKQNSEKILFHGKRADAIVKGMLQHSRQTKGMKESTDINALCDEYLRLSYHGLRAKDKSFNADFKIDFDKSIGKINIVPQDIGRVLLNLFNNAFYAVNEKQKLIANSYQPTAEIKTRRIKDMVEITVSDNGNGIPQSIIDKIFQPFFTTKPTGEGTGLGLSLAYDIITKEHNGTIRVESKEGEGSKFVVELPT